MEFVSTYKRFSITFKPDRTVIVDEQPQLKRGIRAEFRPRDLGGSYYDTKWWETFNIQSGKKLLKSEKELIDMFLASPALGKSFYRVKEETPKTEPVLAVKSSKVKEIKKG